MGDVTLKPIPGVPGYFAGDDGTIRRDQHAGEGYGGTCTARRDPASPTRYLNISLRCDGARRQRYRVNRLIATAFHGLAPEGMVARHLNGDRLNNRPDNLGWATQADNIADKIVHGTVARGQHNGNARLTDEHAAEIIRRALAGEVIAALAKEYGIHRETVRGLKNGRYRPYLTLVPSQASA